MTTIFEKPEFKAYTALFNGITDAIAILQDAQKQAEELYISAADFDDNPCTHAFKNKMLQNHNRLHPNLQLATSRIIQNIEAFEQLCHEPLSGEKLEEMECIAVQDGDYLKQALIALKQVYDAVQAETKE